ncbi:MAG: aminotransferase class V-fold PLP-dependent enzyme [Clostridia bacterium]|nr:aminotransferase class V-fold PLP-dependent enzyme [Clostridia bacterium]
MIYLDNAATTKPDESCLEKASIFNVDNFYNPSALYREGLNNASEIKKAKKTILKCIGATQEFECLFTSCGSESDNQAIFCAVKRGVYVTDKGEHSAVYKSFLELKNRGNTVEFIDLNSDGSVNIDKLFDYVKNNRVDFVSIIHVNNETGAINDVNFIAKTLKSINPKIVFHVDGVQAYGKIPYVLSRDIDLYSISAHKINALKGVGALIKKKKVSIAPLIFGGGQENGLRSGTENIFGIKVFEYASAKHYDNILESYNYVLGLKNRFIELLDRDVFTIISSDNSSPYILSVSAKGVRGEVLMHSLEEYKIIVGNGSACSSKNPFSRVVEACGYDKKILDGVVRISFSIENTLEEVEFAVDKLNCTARKLKGIMRV